MVIKQLRVIRKQNGFTQQQVADMLGISRSAYNGYERGRRSPDVDTIEKLSRFYSVPIARFFGEVPSEFLYEESYYEGQSDLRYISQLSKSEHELVYNFRIMKDVDKQFMIDASRVRKDDALNKE